MLFENVFGFFCLAGRLCVNVSSLPAGAQALLGLPVNAYSMLNIFCRIHPVSVEDLWSCAEYKSWNHFTLGYVERQIYLDHLLKVAAMLLKTPGNILPGKWLVVFVQYFHLVRIFFTVNSWSLWTLLPRQRFPKICSFLGWNPGSCSRILEV